jgi:hypothetical protein
MGNNLGWKNGGACKYGRDGGQSKFIEPALFDASLKIGSDLENGCGVTKA